MVTFNASFSDNITAQQQRGIIEALEIFGGHLLDNVTINLAFTNTNLFGTTSVKAGAIPTYVGGLDTSKINFNEGVIASEAYDNVISYEDFHNALSADRRTWVDDSYVASAGANSSILGSIIHSSFTDRSIKGMQMTNANAKAVGLGDRVDTNIDAVIAFNSEAEFTAAEFQDVVLHEVAHAIGFTSSADSVTSWGEYFAALDTSWIKFLPTGAYVAEEEERYRINPLDLGRYTTDQNGNAVRSLFAPDESGDVAETFFSLDGGETKTSNFASGSVYNNYKHHTQEGDFFFQGSHWSNDQNDGGIMDANFDNLHYVHDNFTSDDLRAFDAIGWDVSYAGNYQASTVNVFDWDENTVADVSKVLEARRFRVKSTRSTYTRFSEDGSAASTQSNFLEDLIAEVNTPSTAETIRIEAEDAHSLSEFDIRSNADASGGKLVDLFGNVADETGNATFVFDGVAGNYNLNLALFDENDGVGSVEVYVNDVKQGTTLSLDKNLGSSAANFRTATTLTAVSDVALRKGDTIRVTGYEQGGEHIRFDYIEFEPVVVEVEPELDISSFLASSQAPSYAFRLEAESDYSWKTDNFTPTNISHLSDSASQDIVLDLGGGSLNESGVVQYTFNGVADTYDVDLGLYDENDGVSELSVFVNDVRVGEKIYLDQQLGSSAPVAETAVSKRILNNFSLQSGDVIEIRATEDNYEYARLDYLDFTPSVFIPAESFKVEAESLGNIDNYRVEDISGASNGQVLSFVGGSRQERGSGEYTFTQSGTYDIAMAAYDENDGTASFSFELNGSQIASTIMDRDLGTSAAKAASATTEVVAYGVEFQAGDVLTVLGQEQNDEHARLDYLEFIAADI